jgi:UDP-GlcNAc:undecaprenyl-phosphate GlcNAc-1-phosphate transferase
VSAIIAGGFVFLAVHMATHGVTANANTDGVRVVLGLALLGAVLAFVPYNFNPASIFMGDTGSMFIGFGLATLMALMAEESPRWFLAAIVMFALPILDTALAFTRRFVNRRPLFSADRHHFHHQLLLRGYSVRRAVLLSYGLTIFFVLLGASVVYMRVRYAAAVYMVVFGSIVVAAYKMGMVHEKVEVAPRHPIGWDTVVAVPSPESVLEVRPTGDDSAITSPVEPGTANGDAATTAAAGNSDDERPAA